MHQIKLYITTSSDLLPVLVRFRESMNRHAEAMQFEEAQRIKEKIEILENYGKARDALLANSENTITQILNNHFGA